MKKRKKLSFQLFITTFTIMTLIMSLIMVFQYFMFDILYENYKKNKLNAKINELAQKIENDELDYFEYNQMEDELNLSYNAYLNITKEDGTDYSKDLLKKLNWYSVVGVTDDNQELKFVISEYDISRYIYGSRILNQGETYCISYLLSQEDEIVLIDISEEFALTEYIGSNYYLSTVKLQEVASSTEYQINEYLYLTYEPEIATVYLGEVEFYEHILERDVRNNINELINIKIVASLKNVEDAASALLSYYPYFLSFSIICSLIVSYIYSRKVSKPIVKISRISKEMAKLNFDIKINYNKENEIGVLGESLNTLADNLHNALSELKDANAQLLIDIQLKKEQEAARKKFVANVSHELKTPLGVIKCYVESLKDQMITKPDSEYYDDMLAEINKMTKLIMEMLELSKIESGDLKLNKNISSVKDIVEDNIISHKFLADEKNMTIKTEGKFIKINADTDKLDSAISNIVHNAVMYGESSTDIIIKSKINQNVCTLSFINTCKGISQSQAEKFFDRFYIGDKSRHESSTGLGLSICRGIFLSHGFNYGIESNGKEIIVWFEYKVNDKI